MRKPISLPQKAQYIWGRDNKQPNDFVIFRKHIKLSNVPEKAWALMSADTKYWLYINGTEAVFEGGLFRESLPGCGYADRVDLAPYLQEGDNVIAVLVHYYGNGGRNSVDSGQAGLILACESLDLYSDASFLCKRHNGFFTVPDSKSSRLFGGHDLGVLGDAADHDFYKPDFSEACFEAATVYPNEVWGEVCERPIPIIKKGTLQLLEVESSSAGISAALPYAMAFLPYIRLNAKGGEKITIKSDRYEVHGGPGDQHNTYRGQCIEYICRPGLNECLFRAYQYGEAFTLDFTENTVEILALGAVETGYDTEQTGHFSCSCQVTNSVVDKAVRTLTCCMRDNFMDCPDRERGQWIGDVSVQASQALMLLDENGAKLVKKAVEDFFLLRKGDVLVGNVPGAHSTELPGQSLLAISELGLLAEYVKYTGDTEILTLSFEPSVNYLKLWSWDEQGLLVPRKGNWRWFDHLYNVDDTVLEHAMYYSALKMAHRTAKHLNRHEYDEFLTEGMARIEELFKTVFWQNTHYGSGKMIDDRANAFAVLTGLADRKHFPQLKVILTSVLNSSVYMENYVLWAMCKMGYIHEAYRRMVGRYYPMSQDKNTTLWEDFNILGTKNHAWSGAPLSIAFKYFCGIDTDDGFSHYTVNPVTDLFEDMTCSFMAKDKKVTVTVHKGQVTIKEK